MAIGLLDRSGSGEWRGSHRPKDYNLEYSANRLPINLTQQRALPRWSSGHQTRSLELVQRLRLTEVVDPPHSSPDPPGFLRLPMLEFH